MNNTPPTFSRREVLLTALSAATVAALPRLAGAQERDALPADAQFSTLLADFAEEILRLSPASATSLGLDSGSRIALKSQLEDASPTGDLRWAGQVKSMLARMQALQRAKLSSGAQIHYDSVHFAATQGVDGLRFSYGGAASGFYGGTAPFPVTQQDGWPQSVR